MAPVEELLEAFRKFDKGGTGTIAVSELAHVLGRISRGDLSRDDVQQLVVSSGADRAKTFGGVDYHAFLWWLFRPPMGSLEDGGRHAGENLEAWLCDYRARAFPALFSQPVPAALPAVPAPVDDVADGDVLLKAVQWNVLADGLAYGEFQLHDHRRAYPEALMECAKCGLIAEERWVPLSRLVNIEGAAWATERCLDEDEEARNRFERSVLDARYRFRLVAREVLSQAPAVCFFQEVDHFGPLARWLLPGGLRGCHAPKLNSTSKYLTIARLWQVVLGTADVGASLVDRLLGMIDGCEAIPREVQLEMIGCLRTDAGARPIFKGLPLLFESHAREVQQLEAWPKLRQALEEQECIREDGVSIFVDDARLAIDEEVFARMASGLPERRVFAGEPLVTERLSNAEVFDSSARAGITYADPTQRCLYHYFAADPKSPVLLLPVLSRSDPELRLLLFCAHLRSGRKPDEEASRQAQILELESVIERARQSAIEVLHGKLVPVVGGCDLNADSEQTLEWKWDGGASEYRCKRIQRAEGEVTTRESAVSRGFTIAMPQGVSVLKERGFHSEQPPKRGMPVLETIDAILTREASHAVAVRSCKVNVELKHMLPNAFEPSDHKGLVAWIQWSKREHQSA